MKPKKPPTKNVSRLSVRSTGALPSASPEIDEHHHLQQEQARAQLLQQQQQQQRAHADRPRQTEVSWTLMRLQRALYGCACLVGQMIERR